MSNGSRQGGNIADLLIGSLMVLYAILIGMVNVPSPFHPLEWADLVLPVIAAVVIIRLPVIHRIRFLSGQNKPVMYWLVAYLTVNWLSAVVNGDQGSVIEVIGRSYLVFVFFVFLLGTLSLKRVRRAHLTRAGLILGGVICLVAILGVIMWCLGYDTLQVQVYADYPYLGSIPRLRYLTPSPAFLLSYAAIPFFWLAVEWMRGSRSAIILWVLGGLALILFLTLSKSIVLIILGVWLIAGLINRWSGKLVWGMAFVLIVVHVVGTHVVVTHEKDLNTLKSPYLSDSELVQWKEWKVIGTSYLSLKQASIPDNTRLWLIGTGPGGFNEYFSELKRAGRYSAHLPDYDPHSTYLGALIETGIDGFILVLLAWLYLIRSSVLRWQKDRNPTDLFFLVIFLVYAVDAISMDMMNFRHLWVLVGVFVAYCTTHKAVK